jgi:Nuclear transport factor 2 (NTF2) domain/RNA recognition motif. (a.k.a. RRM, RBD, or RNP domain)
MSAATTEEGGNAAAPSPLTVGKLFVKQYYQTLQTSTDQIHRFYQPSSLLSDAEGSTPTDPSGLENYDIAGRWGIIEGETKGFAMEIGAIDAQTSINNSILLVVTGSVSSSHKDPRKTFIHTFFLTYLPNTKRFYVANDVLRFLEDKQHHVIEEELEEKLEEAPKEAVDVYETPTPESDEKATPVPESDEPSPGGGVEESKEVEEEDTPGAVDEPVAEPGVEEVPKAEAKKETKPEGKEGGRAKRGKGKAGQQAKQQPTKSTWASLVASTPSASSTPVPPSPARPVAAEKVESVEKAAVPATVPSSKDKDKEIVSKDKGVQQRHKRDPDCTLVLKNLPDGAKDSELVALFEGFASSTGGKILGTTVSVHRGLGFVDFDSVAPVTAAVAKHKETPIELNGRALEVDQKTAEQRSRRNKVVISTPGGGTQGNGSAFKGGSGGRSNQFRRENKGRGDRGGKGRGSGNSGNSGE